MKKMLLIMLLVMPEIQAADTSSWYKVSKSMKESIFR